MIIKYDKTKNIFMRTLMSGEERKEGKQKKKA